MMDDECMTVTDLTELIKNIFKINFDEPFYILGEVSNFRTSKNNVYFNLKDENAMINCVIWDYDKKKTSKIENGSKIKAYGNMNVFSKSGTYIFTIYNYNTIGIGNLFQEYDNLKTHYNKLGYFNENIKKKLPNVINKVGILTAIDGAALQDFLYVTKKNNFLGKIYVKNCIVQGKDCPLSIVNGLKEVDKLNLDVIVIARGGGGFEDLYGFSDKKVIEEIHNSNTVIISAIGHETDFMISDFVADIRAPTPSIAGELISNKKTYNSGEINAILNHINTIINSKITHVNNIVDKCSRINTPNKIIEKERHNIELFHMNVLNTIHKRIGNYETLLHNIKCKRATLTENVMCNVYGFDGMEIKNLEQFILATDKRKKLKLKFIDGETIFDIRNIKVNEHK